MDNTPMLGDDPGSGGLDRRAVLRRGAILGGALVWTVPAVQTLAGPAFAAGSALCTVELIGKYDPDGPHKPQPPVCGTITFAPTPDCCNCVGDNGGSVVAIALCALFGACQVQSITPGGC